MKTAPKKTAGPGAIPTRLRRAPAPALNQNNHALFPRPRPRSGTTGNPKGVLLSHRVVVLHALGTVMGENGGIF